MPLLAARSALRDIMPFLLSTRLFRPRGSLAAALIALALAPAACVEAATEHRVRANAFLRGGDAEGAVRECDLGLAQKVDDVGLLILRGKALFELERYDDARASYARAVEKGTGTGDALEEAHLGLAMVATRKDDWAAARTHFEALVTRNEKDSTSHLNVARSCLKLKDLACAVSHAEAAGKLRGDDEGVLYTLGTVYLAAGQLNEADLTFQHICEVVPGASSCPYGLALVAATRGDKAKALAELERAVSRKVPSPGQIAADPAFASLKDDPQFSAIVARAGGQK
jgi:Flp pilus assembly protein TadD